MLYAKEVTDNDELREINKLNQQNLKINLSAEEQQQQGFVTWLYSFSLLQQMHNITPAIIVKDDDKVIGYALVTPIEAGSFHPDLQTMINNLQPLIYKSKPLSSYSYYIMGQVCIDKKLSQQRNLSYAFSKA